MVIADLNYLEIAEVNVEGGSRRSPNTAYAGADALALAFGNKTYAETYTDTFTKTGYYFSVAGSSSSSYSETR